MRSLFTTALTAISISCFSQSNFQSIDTIKPPAKYDNVYVRKLYTDSINVSTFVIFVNNEVKEHKHQAHSEQVLVLQGMGMMTLGDKKFKIKKGDLIYIPMNTFHSVISISKKEPLKVISIQTPFYDGTDRIMK